MMDDKNWGLKKKKKTLNNVKSTIVRDADLAPSLPYMDYQRET
jgi:hypothetical protein